VKVRSGRKRRNRNSGLKDGDNTSATGEKNPKSGETSLKEKKNWEPAGENRQRGLISGEEQIKSATVREELGGRS